MTVTDRPRRAPSAGPFAARPVRPALPWPTAVAGGLAVLLAGVPVGAVVQGTGWPGYAAAVVALVVVVGLALHRLGPVVAAAGQTVAALGLLTALFTDEGVLGVLPGPAALGALGELVGRAGEQINTGVAPVPPTPEILLLVTAAFGLMTIAVVVAAVGAGAPAAAGVPLLAIFAVPAALADDLLPWWALAAAALGFGLLLLARDRDAGAGGAARTVRGLPAGAALVGCALAVALGAGTVTGFVGTAGRFEGGAGSGSGGSIGLSPFTSLRGQLEQSEPDELLRVRGLDQPTYLRALTLSDYVPGVGWQATQPAPGATLPGPLAPPLPGVPGDTAAVEVENRAFRDYWLPLYGQPTEVGGLPEAQWVFDEAAGIGYTARPREEDSWTQRAFLPAPTAGQLRAAEGTEGVSQEYLDIDGVPQQVVDLAGQIAGDGTAFDRTLALQEHFTGPGSAFVYSLRTAPGAGGDALVEFLTVGRTGYCEQFASSMAVMLRSVGVPARVAVGFTAGLDAGSYRSVSTSDAHAWVEAWFPGVGWTTFDPTPLSDGRTVVPPYVLEAQNEAAAGETAPAEDDVAQGQETAPAPAPEALDQQAPDPAAATPAAQTPGGLPLWPFALLAALVAAALVPAGVRAALRRRRLAAADAGGPGAGAAAWAEVVAESTDRGVPAVASDTVRGTARRLVREHRLDAAAQQELRELVSAVEASWYGDAHPAGLAGPVRAVRTGVAAGTPLGLRGRLLPRSVLDMLRNRSGRSREPEPERETVDSRG